MDIERARFNMVEQQIRPWDVLDQDGAKAGTIVQRPDTEGFAVLSTAGESLGMAESWEAGREFLLDLARLKRRA